MNEIIINVYITTISYIHYFFHKLSWRTFPNYAAICENELTDLDELEMVSFNELYRL